MITELGTQSPAERRAAEAQLDTHVATYAPAHRRLVGTVRRRLQKRLPAAHEIVYENRDCFVISYSPTEHGYEGVFAIRASAEGASTIGRPAVVRLSEKAIARNRVPFARTGRGPVIVRRRSSKGQRRS